MDRIEFYGGTRGLLTVVKSAMVPPLGAMVSIEGMRWKVISVTYAVDNSDAPKGEQVMRANVDVEQA